MQSPGEHFFDNCIPAYYQAAVCFYKTGDRKTGDLLFAEGMRHGFRGSFGDGTYFRRDEVSWAVKFFLDAYYWRIQTAPTVSTEPLHHDDIRLNALIVEDDLKQGLILDAGCGTGRYMEWLQSPHNHVAGLDIRDSNGKFVQGSLCNIPFTNKTFDCVYCVEALEHAVNQEAAVDEMSRVTKKKVIIIDKPAEINGKMRIAPWEHWLKIAEVENWLLQHWRTAQWRWIDDTFVKWVGSNE
jgi:SAM-dependent methyltransferase